MKSLKCCLIAVLVVSLFAANAEASEGNGFYEDGGLSGLVLNGAGHLTEDTPGALGTATCTLVDTTLCMGGKVIDAGTTCVELVVNGADHIKEDTPGALGTAGGALVDTTIWMGKDIVYASGATCIDGVWNAGAALIEDFPGASCTAGCWVLDTAWGGISGLWCVAFGK